MSVLVALLRLIIIAAFAVGLGMPAASAKPATAAPSAMQADTMQLHPGHDATPDMPAMPHDEICRAHCLGLSMVPAAIAPAPYVGRITPVHVARRAEDAPSCWPLPEGRPPRS